jgi:TonB family protein
MPVLKTFPLLLAFAVVSFSALPRGAAASFARGFTKVLQTTGRQSSLPSGGVQRAGEPGVTNPRILRQVKPKYTAEAMHAKVEGTVVVECVVQTDGTVDAVRVVKSLDSVYGLDDEAVKAARQWRFVPGMKGDVAVPVLITIELSFRLAMHESAVPFSTPALFDSVPSAKNFTANVMSFLDPAPDWPMAERNCPGAYVRFPYPPGWRVSEDASSSDWFVAQSDDGVRLLLVSQLQPVTWPQSTGGGATRSELQQLRDALQRRLSATRSHARVDANGWIPMPSRIWVWYEIRVPAGDRSIPKGIAPDDQRRFDGARWWRFIRNAGPASSPSPRELTVDCFVMRLRGASDAQADEDVRLAGPQFLAMLRRMSVEVR